MRIGIIHNLAKKCFIGPSTDLLSDVEMEVVPQLAAEELSRRGHSISLIQADWNLITSCRDANITIALNLAEGFEEYNSHEHLVPCLLEYGRIPYTGADPTNMLLVRDKLLTKHIIQATGVQTPKFHLFSTINVDKPVGLSYPMILKPVREEASIGITYESVVFDDVALKYRVRQLYVTYQQPVLAEEYIVGREISVGVWGNSDPTTLPPCEFLFKQESPFHKFRSFEHKWHGPRESMVLTNDIDQSTICRLNEIAISAHTILGCRDYSRVDFRLSTAGQIYFLEHNFNPGIGPNIHGLCNTFTMMAEYAGISFGDMLEKIIAIACKRNGIA